MIHANPFCAQTRLSKNNQALPGHNHLLHVMQVEPSADQRLTESDCLRFLKRRFKNFLPSAKTTQRSFDYLAAQTNRTVAFLARTMRELGASFVPARTTTEQIFYCL